MQETAPCEVNVNEDKNAIWWAKDVEAELQLESRKMLEEYAGIAADRVVAHIRQTRERAYKCAPYPSIAALTWLNPYINLHPAKARILDKVKGGASMIDCACMFAPDLRQLAYEGAPTDKMYGFDVQPGFFDLSYEFYHDRARFRADFFTADILKDLDESPLGDLKGKIDIIWCAKILHLFDRPGQVDIASRLVALLKPQPGSMIAGTQNGYPGTFEVQLSDNNFGGQQRVAFLGNADTMKAMWQEIGQRTSTQWDVESTMLDLRPIGRHEDDGSEYKKITGYNLQWTATLR